MNSADKKLIPTVKDIDLKDKRVLLRLDFDFLFEKGLKITDSHRFNLVVPIIKNLIKENAKTVIAANYANQDKNKDAEYSMEKFADVLCEVFNCEVYLTEELVGQVVNKISHDMLPGAILLLNNFNDIKDEKRNDPAFAKRLSEVADIYINEAITLSHLELSSTNSILDCYDKRQVFIGENFANEYSLMKTLTDKNRPAALLINTDAIKEGIDIFENLIDEIDKLYLIGGISDSVLNLNNSELNFNMPLDQKNRIECLIKAADVRGIKIFNAVDYYIKDSNGNPEHVNRELLQNKYHLLDIGDSTGNLFSESLSDIKKLVWFGPLPLLSDSSFSGGTSKIFNTIKENNILTLGISGKQDKEYLKYIEAGFFDFFSSCYDTVLRYVRNEELPVLNLIEGKFE